MKRMATAQVLESSSQAPVIEADICDGPVQVVATDSPADCGAECTFLGRTRCEEHERFGTLLRIDYEVYEPMARQALRDLGRQAAARFGCRWVRVVHARGAIAPGEASVVIQVACPHRKSAFSACRYLIDQIKVQLPVWKREIWQRGETFVEGSEVRASHDSENGKTTR
jgi:molybdopterin synthase catalytic subunit